jgi:hypothetical protein
MKLGNREQLGKFTKTVRLVRKDFEVELLVSSLPFAFNDFLESKGFVRPKVPNTRKLVDGKGTSINGEIATELDINDPKFLADLRIYDRRITAVMFVTHLLDGPNFDPGVPRPSEEASAESWIAYADALADGMLALGLVDADVSAIMEVGASLGEGIGQTDYEDNDFLSVEGSASTSETSDAASSTTNEESPA